MVEAIKFLLTGQDRTKASFDSANRGLKSLDRSSGNLLKSWSRLTIVATGLTRAFKMATGFASSFTQKAKLQADATIQIAAALNKTGQEVRQNTANVQKWSAEWSKATTFTDRYIQSLTRVGIEFGLTAEKSFKLMQAVSDRAFQVGREPLDMMRQASKGVVGMSKDFVELGVQISKSADEAQRFNEMVTQMRSGISEAVALLPTAAFQKLANILEDLQEKIGFIITSTRTFQLVMSSLMGWVDQLNTALSNPEAFKAMVNMIDLVVDRLVWAATHGFALFADGLATLEMGIRKLVHQLSALRMWFDRDFAATIKNARKTILKLSDVMPDLRRNVKSLTWEKRMLVAQYNRAVEVLRENGFLMTEQEQGYREFAEVVRGLHKKFNLMNRELKLTPDLIQQIIDKFDEMGGGEDPRLQQMREKQAELQEELRQMWSEAGSDYANVFQLAMIEAFDEQVGYKEAFKNMGRNAKDAFIGQMSRAAFEPVQVVLGELAHAVMEPFRIVGQVIAKMIRLLLSPLTALFEMMGAKMAAMLGIQNSAALTAKAQLGAIQLQMVAMMPTLSTAATLASIASFGGAAAAGASAMVGAFGTVNSAIAASLAIPAREGAVVDPRPGGTLYQVGEAGEREHIHPEKRLRRLFREEAGGLGGSGGGVTVTGDMILQAADPESMLEQVGEVIGNLLLDARDLGSTRFAY